MKLLATASSTCSIPQTGKSRLKHVQRKGSSRNIACHLHLRLHPNPFQPRVSLTVVCSGTLHLQKSCLRFEYSLTRSSHTASIISSRTGGKRLRGSSLEAHPSFANAQRPSGPRPPQPPRRRLEHLLFPSAEVMLPDPRYLQLRSGSIPPLHRVYQCKCLHFRDPIYAARLL
jgi:hypothetical protein